MNKIDHRGARNPNAVLTPALVAEMKRLHKAGFGYGYVAKWIGVTKSCAQKVLTGRTWKKKLPKKFVKRAGSSQRARRSHTGR